MTVRLSAGSPRLASAERFGAELRKAMRARKASAIRLSEATGCTKSAINNWRSAGNLPRLSTAQLLADALAWPALMAVAREGRTVVCARCGRGFTHEGGGAVKYCSTACREVDAQLRAPQSGQLLAARLDALLAVPGPVRRSELEAAVAEHRESDARRVRKQDRALMALASLQGAVDAMCAGCEPDGLCRDASCALRPASPLPMAADRVAERIRPAGSAWDDGHRDRMLAVVRESNARRWSREGERERQSAESSARFAAMTTEEREALGRRISVGRRRSA